MSRQPNILFITSDQQHWNTIGKHFPEIKTPNLDRLANEGFLSNRAYCPNPTCTPTRSSIITGMYPSRHGAWSLGTKLPEDVPTIGDQFQAAGYDCSLIGKAHFQPLVTSEKYPSIESYPQLKDLDFWRDFNGPFYGFNHVELARQHGDETHVGQHYALWLESKGFTEWRDHYQNRWGPFDFSDGHTNPPQQHSWSLPEEYHSNTWITERSISQLRKARAKDQPFFLWASYFDPHPPYLVPEPWASMYDPANVTVPQVVPGEHTNNPQILRKTQEPNADFSCYDSQGVGNHGLHPHQQDKETLARDIATYYGMITFLDAQVGKLLDEIEEQGLADNTLVVFTSDHGHYYGQHGLIAKGPFHYEDGIRVPFIARWPGHIEPNQESNALISLVDLPITFLSAANLPDMPDTQGADQLPVWRGEADRVRDNLVVEHRAQRREIHMKTFVNERYKLTVHFRLDEGELYDLQTDPGEIKNLWNEPSALPLREELTRELLFAEMEKEPISMPRVSPA